MLPLAAAYLARVYSYITLGRGVTTCGGRRSGWLRLAPPGPAAGSGSGAGSETIWDEGREVLGHCSR
jgi:hypothetical protein